KIELKTIKGTSITMMTEVNDMFIKSTKNKLAACVLKKDFNSIKDLLDYRKVGGAPLLGLDGYVLKAHGSSDALAFHNALRQAKRMAESGALDKIKEKVGEE